MRHAIKVTLRRRAANKQGLKKLHGPTIKADTPSYLKFPDPKARAKGMRGDDISDGLRALADYLDRNPKLKALVQRGQFDRIR